MDGVDDVEGVCTGGVDVDLACRGGVGVLGEDELESRAGLGGGAGLATLESDDVVAAVLMISQLKARSPT